MWNATPKQYTTTRFGPKPSGCREWVAATRPAGRLIPLYWIISLRQADEGVVGGAGDDMVGTGFAARWGD